MTSYLKIFALSLLALLGVFTATAFAAAAAAPESESLLEMLRPVWEAFSQGKQLHAGMLALVVVIAAMKRYAPGKLGVWLATDIGGALTTLGMAFGASMAAATVDGAGLSAAMVKSALGIAVGAAGGYSLVKKLVIEPFLKPWSKKLPAWTAPIFAVVFWFFDKKSPVETAEAAGDEAVAKKPAEGVKSVAGAPTEVE